MQKAEKAAIVRRFSEKSAYFFIFSLDKRGIV